MPISTSIVVESKIKTTILYFRIHVQSAYLNLYISVTQSHTYYSTSVIGRAPVFDRHYNDCTINFSAISLHHTHHIISKSSSSWSSSGPSLRNWNPFHVASAAWWPESCSVRRRNRSDRNFAVPLGQPILAHSHSLTHTQMHHVKQKAYDRYD